jgi:hypothetical protein
MRPSLLSWVAVASIGVSLGGGCGGQRQAASPPRAPSENQPTNHVKMVAALEAVLRNDTEREEIVTFEASTRRAPPFVQFAGSSHTGLELIFPLPKDQGEAQRAEAFFKEMGIPLAENDAYADPDGEPTSKDRTFRKKFGKDVEAAAEIAEQIFAHVYQLPADFPLRVLD